MLTSKLYDRLYAAEGSTTQIPSNDELTLLKDNYFHASDKYFGDLLQAIKLLSPGSNILEIGSSWGYFLYQAQQHGFDATGVEVSEPRRLFGIQNLGVDIVENISKLNGRVFDVVYTAHTKRAFY